MVVYSLCIKGMTQYILEIAMSADGGVDSVDGSIGAETLMSTALSWFHSLTGGSQQQQQQYRYHQVLLQQQRRLETIKHASIGNVGGRIGGRLASGTNLSVWEGSGAWLPFKNLCLTGCAIPSIVHSVRFLWSGVRRPDVVVEILSLVPVNLLSIYFADLKSVQLLGAIGIAAGMCQWCAATQMSERGKKVI
jgi:hypothetical protein